MSSRFGSRPWQPYLPPMCGRGRVRLSSDVSEIKLVFSIPSEQPTPNIATRRLRAPDDLCRSGDAKDLDETSHLVEQVSVSIVLAPFSQDDHGNKAWSDLLNPAGVFQDDNRQNESQCRRPG